MKSQTIRATELPSYVSMLSGEQFKHGISQAVADVQRSAGKERGVVVVAQTVPERRQICFSGTNVHERAINELNGLSMKNVGFLLEWAGQHEGEIGDLNPTNLPFGIGVPICTPVAPMIHGHVFLFSDEHVSDKTKSSLTDIAYQLAFVMFSRILRRESAEQSAIFRHSILGPVQGILSGARYATHLLSEHSHGEEIRKVRSDIEVEAEEIRLLRAKSRLLDSQLAPRATSLMIQLKELAPILESVVEKCGIVAKRRRIAIRLKVEDGLRPFLFDKEAVYLMVYEMVSNAIKYSMYSTAVKVIAQSRGRQTEVVVENFCPFSPKLDMRVFELGYRARAGYVQSPAGSGMGLSMVQQLVTAHGGVVRCEQREIIGGEKNLALQKVNEGPKELYLVRFYIRLPEEPIGREWEHEAAEVNKD